MAKRKNSQNSEKKSAPGASLREAAAALGITRAALLKYIDRGLPSPLVRERRTVDIAAARAWIEDHEAGAVIEDRMVLPLNPEDPRARRDRASASLKAYKLAQEYHHAIPLDVVSARFANAVTELNSALKTVPASVADKIPLMTSDNAAAFIAPFIEDALGFLDADDEEGTKAWPDPLRIVIDFPSDDVDEFEAFAPMLSPGDDRAKLAAMQATKYNAEATMLANTLIFHEDLVPMLTGVCEMIRARFREVPDAVAAMLASDGNAAHFTRACIVYQLDRAREDSIGALYERTGRDRPDFQLVEPGNVVDDEPLEDMDGRADFESDDEFQDA
jgi:hypothetical protein